MINNIKQYGWVPGGEFIADNRLEYRYVGCISKNRKDFRSSDKSLGNYSESKNLERPVLVFIRP